MEIDRLEGIKTLLTMSALGLSGWGLPYLSQTIALNIDAISVDIAAAAERQPILGHLIDAVIGVAEDAR